MSYLMPTYARQPISFVRGQGSYLYTADGTAYLDALTGIAVCGLGHCHPAISHAMKEQADTLIHTSNLYQIDWQEKAGEILCQKAGMDKVFFANSGAEANECALKLARLYAHNQSKSHPKVIVMEHAFHGRTLLTVTATANPKARTGFFTLDDDFIRVPFNDVSAVEALIDDKDICAVFVEPIQGEGGLHTPSDDYLEKLQNICHTNDWLFMLDEVQTGNGRTGKYFAYQYSNVKPDVLTTAKGLGNGFPVGACMVSGRAKDLFGAGSHGSTFGGTPFGCRVVCAVYDELTDEVMKNAMRESDFIRQSVREHFPQIDVRGRGMMIGFGLPDGVDCTHIVDMARDEFYLILNVTGGNVIRLLPTLNISHDDTVILTNRLIGLLEKTLE
ncbi:MULTISPECIES: aspartate aminotransferase family protein [Moraxella]|uniref:Acetylornithine aminotransferase n=1 Tax=Moraxella lacunata TaxID=477 RepID=A0A1B8Q6Q5_MORLA|nr:MULTISPECIES: aspartate aminotransferase family protein [Moraxella]MBE9579664.1 aspartate aminotransferase family protein [Moraxella sp. K1664]MBE9588954.1 aspartate aminotransferase family protein [Moraxella sp. K1630]MBE9591412.1 aspartate aminotransferase family protein [Moraxella sp. K127]MBE9597221.1 aspartate aminotransferase family protein [Moraxella sp. K2450]MDI4483557.1 aspartate aminotransferase family protein [Moraxella lacunata]